MLKQLLFALILPAILLQDTLAQPALYYINIDTGIERSNLFGSNREVLILGSEVKARGLALDLWNQKIYWTDWVADKIQRSDMDGTNIEDVIVSDLSLPNGIALDVEAEMMYWTDSGTRDIKRAMMDGTEMEVLVTYQNINFGDIDLDLGARKMYWTEWGDGAPIGKVKRANFDGSAIEEVVVAQGSVLKGIALDLEARKVYWTDMTYGTVNRADFDGDDIEELVTGLTTPLGLALDLENDKMYWTDLGSRKLQRASLDGSQVENVITEDFEKPHGVAVDPDLPIPVNTTDKEAQWTVSLFPNPTYEYLYIGNLPERMRAIVSNAEGKVVVNTLVEMEGVQLAVADWPVGLYTLQLINARNQSYSYQFVKQ